MKNYKSKENFNCHALQYGTDIEAEQYVEHCYLDYQNEITPIPGDMMGTPKNAFYAVKTPSGWHKIVVGDFIVVKENETVVLTESQFELMFEEI